MIYDDTQRKSIALVLEAFWLAIKLGGRIEIVSASYISYRKVRFKRNRHFRYMSDTDRPKDLLVNNFARRHTWDGQRTYMF